MKKVIMIDEEAYFNAEKEALEKAKELPEFVKLMLMCFSLDIKRRLFSGKEDNENGFEEG